MLIDDFKARFPVFDFAKYDANINILADVWPFYYGGAYPDDQEIILNLIAHMLISEESAKSSTNKDISSTSAGNVSLSFAALSPSSSERSDWLRSTKYGQKYLMLTRSRAGGFFV